MNCWEQLIQKANAAAPAARRKPRQIEHSIQCACVKWFRLRYPDMAKRLIAVGNGGKRDAATGAYLKREGVLSGVSDLVLFAKRGQYGALLIEMKTTQKSSRQEDPQRLWEADLTSQGEYRYVLCRSLDSFIQQVQAYLSLPAPLPISPDSSRS